MCRERITVETKLEKESRFLKIYAVAVTLAYSEVFLLLAFAARNNRRKFEKIEMEHANDRVISNRRGLTLGDYVEKELNR